jgi:prepilin-type N-terminal cleavage/methylation domain-containing protein
MITDNFHLKTRLGFTIVELLVVVVIIGILATITMVSYNGISNKAIVASIQSDLDNASRVLKMDQITGESLPTTLALANGGKGINPSQSLDDITYIPDNTSNPKYFCLEYTKGSNTYAVDSNSQPSKGVCLKNLVSNGDFSSGTASWTGYYAGVTASGNTATVTGNGAASTPYVAFSSLGNWALGKKVYSLAQMRVTNSSCTSLSLSNYASGMSPNTIFATSVSNPTINSWYTLSGVTTLASGGVSTYNIQLGDAYADAATANGKSMEIKYVLAIDLTTVFGAGNEPTKAQMDAIMAGYTNNWFFATGKVSL